MIFKPFLAAVASLIEDFPAARAVARPRAPAAAARDPRQAAAARPQLWNASIRDGLAALCAARNMCDGATGDHAVRSGSGDGPDAASVSLLSSLLARRPEPCAARALLAGRSEHHAEPGPSRCIDCATAHWTERRRRVLPRPDGLLAPEAFPEAARNFIRERRPDGVIAAAGIVSPDRLETARRSKQLHANASVRPDART